MDNLAGFSDPDAATKLLANLQAAGSDCELHTYPNVGHAFMNDTPDPYATWEARQKAQGFPPYDETQVNVAWSRLLRFFEKHLVG
jgi:carboxymethylenebutenolidase